MIFFHDKQWYRPEPLFAVDEEDEEEDDDEGEGEEENGPKDAQATSQSHEQPSDTSSETGATQERSSSPTSSERTVRSGPSEIPSSTTTKKPEYEFLLFNYLLRFVHREGQIGDFARAGLLFLMDVAMSPVDPLQKQDDTLATSTSTTSTTENDPNTDAALALAEYILDGDFSEVLAAGLAAVYSVLPTKLEISQPAKAEVTSGSTMVLGASSGIPSEDKDAEEQSDRPMGLEESSNPDFKSRLDHFLKLLEFLQDVLRRNNAPDLPDEALDPSSLVGSAIAQSILNAVRRVFFENVLYPSILECSDSDGSAVAVMSYIDISLRTLGLGQLGDLLVDFLMSEDNTTEDLTLSRMRPHSLLNLNGPPPSKSFRPDRATRARRRKSTAMVLLEMEAPDSRRPSEYFTSMGRFTLKDLLLSSLRSKSHPTNTAALQLLHSLMQMYCRVCVDRLLLVIPDPYSTSYPYPLALPAPPVSETIKDEEDEAFVYPGTEDTAASPDPLPIFPVPDTTYYTHEREMGLYLTLVSRLDPNHTEDAFSTGYEHYLRDAVLTIQSQDCSSWDVDPDVRAKAKHRLNPNDPIMSSVLENLRKFFSNTPELNMALTGVLATLAVCPDRSLAGWLTFMPKDPDFSSPPQSTTLDIPQSKRDGDDRSIDFSVEEKLLSESHSLPATSIDEQSRPVVHSIFHGLVSQLERYRQMVDDFDKFLRERRQGLLFNENLTDALTLALELDSTMPPRSMTPVSMTTSTPSEPSTPKAKAKSKATSSFVSFLTPKKSKPSKPSTEPATQSKSKALDVSPFGAHYQRTNAIEVEPFLAPAPSSGPWQPAKPKKFNAAEDDVFTSSAQWGGETTTEMEAVDEHAVEDRDAKPAMVTLSRLLDNVVILEESIKELVAIIHARRSLGIDAIRYL